jgi:DNA-binding NtrC family response regulator
LIIASSGPAITFDRSTEVAETNRLRAQIHQWRKRDAAWGGIAAAGSSKHAQRLRAQVQLAACTFHDLSIVGPSGCGGEEIARRIHLTTASTNSPESRPKSLASPGPLVVVEGPLMDAELLEASLSPAAAFLGDERKAVVGQSCTILIRGLDDTALDVQSRIEQFLSAHAGSVRLIGLLSSSVEQASRQEKLTAGLAGRLEVLSLRVEALAARVEDIPLIAAALVDSRHVNNHSTAERLNRAALDRLVLYPWPGNFDEIDSAIRQAMAACTGPAIGPEHLPLAIRSFQVSEPVRQKEAIEQDLDRALEQYELRLIKSALDAAKGNRSEAARMLGISRARLLRRIDESEPGT